MYEVDKQLFIGKKISPKLQSELDNCAPGTEHYFKEDKPESLRILSLGSEMLIGRFLAVAALTLQANDSGTSIWTRGK